MSWNVLNIMKMNPKLKNIKEMHQWLHSKPHIKIHNISQQLSYSRSLHKYRLAIINPETDFSKNIENIKAISVKAPSVGFIFSGQWCL